MNNPIDAHFATPYLTKLYLIALSSLALLTILGHLLLQWALNQHANDTHLVDVASRQLLLSEKLGKTALIIQFSNNYDTRVAYVEEFRNTLDLLEKSHSGLQGGDSELRLSGYNSIPIINLFAALQESYGSLDNLAKDLLMVVDQGPFHSTLPANTSTLVGQLIDAQYAFRPQMEAIVTQYKMETLAHLSQFKRLDFVLASLILIVLLLKALYLFQPTLQKLEHTKQELHKTQKTVRKTETWLQGLLDHLPAFVTLKDFQGRYLFINRPLAKLWRTTPEHILGKTDYDLLHSELAKITQAHDRQILKTNSSQTFEEQLPHSDGLHTYSAIKFPIYDGIHGPSAICTIATDITNFQHTEQTLEECELLLEVLLTATVQVILILTPEGIVRHANQAAAQWLQIPKDKLLNANFYTLSLPELRDTRRDKFIEALETRTPLTFTEKYPDGVFQIHVYPIAIHGKMPSKLAIISATPMALSPTWAAESSSLDKSPPETMKLQPLAATEKNIDLLSTGEFRMITGEGKLLWLRDSNTPVHQTLSSLSPQPTVVAPSAPKDTVVQIEAPWVQSPTVHSSDTIELQDLCQRILNSIPDGILIADATQPDFPLIFVNPAFERLTGYSASEALGRNCRFLQGTDKQQAALDQIRTALRFGHSCKVTLRNYRKDGSQFWNQLSLTPLYDTEGQLSHFVGVQVDITPQKIAEKLLQDSENQFRSLTERIAAAIIIFQEEQLLYVNPAVTSLTGYTGTEILQLRPWELVHPDCQAMIKERSLARQRGEPVAARYETKIITKQSQERWLDVIEYSIEYQGKTAVLASAFDITDRKCAEEALRHIVEGVSAHTGENFLKTMMEYLVTTLQVRYAFIGELSVNDPYRMCTLFVVNSDLQMLENFEYDLHGTPCEKLVKGEVPCCSYAKEVQKFYPNHPLLTQLGIESCVATPLFDTNSKVMGLLAIMDVKPLYHLPLVESMLQIFAARSSAELERLQTLVVLQREHSLLAQRVLERTAELSVANAEIAKAARLKDEFLANMSHELRTPLSTILTLSEALQNEMYGAITLQQHEVLRTMMDRGHHLFNLMSDILDLAKIEAGRLQLKILPVSPKVLSNACLRQVKSLAEKKQLQLTATLDSEVTTILADERCLNKILQNLLTNAIKFTAKGGVVNLEIKGDKERGTVSLIVSDTGIGIARQNMANLFKLFEQLDAGLAREHEGAGLGLFLVYRLAEMHGGSVAVYSEEGKGSRFTVTLPWLFEEEAQEFKDLEKPLASHQNAVILLAAADPNYFERWAALLELHGYQVITAQNGIQAIEKSRLDSPDLILMDCQMPVLDGLKATSQIRVNPECCNIPIVLLTGLTVPGDRERCLEAGATQYLVKPLNVREIIREIRQLLGSNA